MGPKDGTGPSDHERTTMTTIAKLAAAAAVALAAATGAAHAQSAPAGGQWFKACAQQGDNNICNVQNIRQADTGQLLTAVSLITVDGANAQKIFQVSVPTGRLIAPGIAMQIDANKAQRIPFGLCLPDRCIAEAPLTDAMVASLKRGGKMTLTSVNFQRKPNPIEMTLSGFTAAYDGEGIQQDELAKRQQALAAELQKKQADFQAKMKAAQDEAKAQ